MTAWSVEQTGGPNCYPGRDMTAAHSHLNVTDLEFDIVRTEIAATLNYVGVPKKEHDEFIAIVEGYRPFVLKKD